ncbi:S1-like domain-containing RNA-binding protein [Catenovulum sp. 2E275]|uniref:CvfB family protein n=1 Tax=Catenovulum sp. 2E275 TaxID=2980497 RepID=UPI0021D00F4F|nr:S1-like domain-containing RNA-binding protein [Catenovulum sp. 2E275]MCU4675335.1 S1-like domain-containing RNA-binding protein [Catenovulum sp. 2E275]
MIALGKTCTLTVLKIVDFGYYLDAAHLGEILLPKKHAKKAFEIGEKITVFLYLDSKDRPIATMQKPKAEIGQFAYLTVTETTDFGAFVDWGLDKDVFVPIKEQKRPMQIGDSHLVYIYQDKLDQRVVASSKIDKFLDQTPANYQPKQAVDLIIANTTDLGFKAIIDHKHWGVLYKGDVFQRLSFGQYKKGFIKQVRDDGKIDLTLQGGQETRDKYAKIIENYLQKNNGFAPVHDKSDPDLIYQTFGMSKAAFKRCIGGLYKAGVLTIEKDGIRLNK